MNLNIPEGDGHPQLRPGAEVLEVGDDKLHIAFPNHTVTFTSTVVVRAVKYLLSGMQTRLSSRELVGKISVDTGMETGIVHYVLDMLRETDCLYWDDDDRKSGQVTWPLWEYYAAIGRNPARVEELLRSSRAIVISSQRSRAVLSALLDESSIRADVIAVDPGVSASELTGLLERARAGDVQLMACWDFAYRSLAAKLMNEAAMAGVPVLFGSCEGLMGRIGPYVIAKSTPCLECLNGRLLANSGAEETHCFSAYRLQRHACVPRSAPCHPAFLKAMASHFVLELAEILLRRPPRTIGAFQEYEMADGVAVRRVIHRLPRCSACHQSTPPRFAWNAAFGSPEVKANSIEG